MGLSCSIEPTGLPPIIKWAGGKERELKAIFSNMPQAFGNYYEPFVGGGSVFTSVQAKRKLINDISGELIGLYRCVATCDSSFYDWVENIMDVWRRMLSFADRHKELCAEYIDYRNDRLTDEGIRDAVWSFLLSNASELNDVLLARFRWHREVYVSELRRNLVGKIARMKRVERERHVMPVEDISRNIETALVGALYMYFRCLHNDDRLMSSDTALGTAVFFFIRNYAYSGMFRYNADGGFNVPYGGMGYNHKSLGKKMDYYKSKALAEHFRATDIFNMDFETFLASNPPQPNDFVFLDPPYDSTFSTYAKNRFTQDDHIRLADYLINKCNGKWMMVIKNTPFILSLYDKSGLAISAFDKKYTVSFMNRNDKKAEHLIIRNYL